MRCRSLLLLCLTELRDFPLQVLDSTPRGNDRGDLSCALCRMAVTCVTILGVLFVVYSALIFAFGRALSTSPRYYICVAERVSSIRVRSHPALIAALGSRWPHLLAVLGTEATLNIRAVCRRRERRPDAVCIHYVKVLSEEWQAPSACGLLSFIRASSAGFPFL